MRSDRPEKVLLTSIKTLTFHKDGMTKARRVSPIPQLTCKGKACNRFQPDVVQCSNTGDDGLGNVQWKCEADMPSNFRFGAVEVSCEGYNRPGDRYVLKGSCGLEYNLMRVDSDFESGKMPYVPGKGTNWASLLFSIAFFSMLAVILYSFLRSCIRRISPRHTPPPASRFWPFSGGGGGGGGPGFGGGPSGGGSSGGGPSGAPPPPYSKFQSSTNTSVPGATPDPATQAGTGRPGFWTGLGLGGIAAYLAANAAATRERNRMREREMERSTWLGGGRGLGYNSMADGTGVFGGGARRRGWEDSRWGGGASGSGSRRSDDDMGQMRRSTGFGGTNVR